MIAFKKSNDDYIQQNNQYRSTRKTRKKRGIAFCHTLTVDKKISEHYRTSTKFKFPVL